jgi:rfaE bifunctional protein kinase chain/domain
MIPSKERLAECSVLVVGDVMLDRYWFGAVERISPEAPVPVVRVTREEERLGGAANVALNVKSLGARVTLLTVVGQDQAALRLRQLLEQSGVTAVVGDDAQLQTIVKLRIIGRSQQLLRVDFESEPATEVLARMLGAFERELPRHHAVLFSDYGKGGLAHIPRMIELAQRAGVPVLVDPKGSDYQRYAGADVITPNRAELAQVIGPWTSEAELRQRVDALRRRLGIGAVLFTRAEQGMSLFDDDGVLDVPAQALEVFDVTGAGDTVIATVAALLAGGASLREATPLANRAGGLVVGRFGTASVGYSELVA